MIFHAYAIIETSMLVVSMVYLCVYVYGDDHITNFHRQNDEM